MFACAGGCPIKSTAPRGSNSLGLGPSNNLVFETNHRSGCLMEGSGLPFKAEARSLWDIIFCLTAGVSFPTFDMAVGQNQWDPIWGRCTTHGMFTVPIKSTAENLASEPYPESYRNHTSHHRVWLCT